MALKVCSIRYQGTAGEIFIDSDDSLKQAISDNDRARRTDLTVIVGGRTHHRSCAPPPPPHLVPLLDSLHVSSR